MSNQIPVFCQLCPWFCNSSSQMWLRIGNTWEFKKKKSAQVSPHGSEVESLALVFCKSPRGF